MIILATGGYKVNNLLLIRTAIPGFIGSVKWIWNVKNALMHGH